MDLPPYGETGVVPPSFERLKPKTKEELVHMRLANETARKVLWAVKTKVKVCYLIEYILKESKPYNVFPFVFMGKCM